MKNNCSADKSALRAEAKKALSDIKNRKEKERAVTEKALNFVQSGNYTKIAVYMSFGTELSTGLLIDGLFGLNKKVYAPTVENDSLVFRLINPLTVYKKGAFGISEPQNEETETEFDVIFVPLVAFDGNNRRLGRGKGFYDRFLQGKICKKIGLAFVEQKFPFVPTEETDVVLDGVFCS